MLSPAVIILRAQLLAGQFQVPVVRAPLESRRDAVAFAVIFIVAHVDAAGDILLPRTEHADEDPHAVVLDALARGYRVRIDSAEHPADSAASGLPALGHDHRSFRRRFPGDFAIVVFDR